jgi:hypothetical protein
MSQVKFRTKLTSFHREVAQAGGTYAAGIAEAYGRKFAQENGAVRPETTILQQIAETTQT